MESILLFLVGLYAASRFNRRLKLQAKEIAKLRQEVARLAALPHPATAPAAEELDPTAEATPEALADTLTEAEPDPTPESVLAAEPAPPPPPPGPSTWQRLEESLASRWLVWLGGATVALAAVFFIKLSIEHGWLGPSVRVAMGLLTGAALIAGGEWLRRRPDQQFIAAIKPDYVPPALTAAGLFAAFASVYGGYALFDLFAPLVAFALLAGLSFAGMALSLLQGPFIAALGLLAGYVTPMLVSTGSPIAWNLFVYLLALTGAGSMVVLWRGWRWLGWGTLVFCTFWPLAWMTGEWKDGDALPVGLFLLAVTGLFLVPARWSHPPPDEAEPPAVAGPLRALLPGWLQPQRRAPADRLARGGSLAMAVCTIALAVTDSHGAVSLAMVALFGALCLVLGRRVERVAGIVWIAALGTLAVLASWSLPLFPLDQPAFNTDGQPVVPRLTDGLPQATLTYLKVSAGLAALYGLGAFAALWNAARVALWASVSALVPLLLLVLAYAQTEPPQTDRDWPMAALGLAALLVAATTPLARNRHRPGAGLGLAAYAAGAVGAISLGATMMLQEAWLTVALALQVPVLAWLERQLRLRELRGIVLLVASAVLVRLAFNPFILDYQGDGFAWILYGYGIPAAGFLLAAHWLRRGWDGPGENPGEKGGDDAVVAVLEAGALVFATLLVSLEIRHFTIGTLGSSSVQLKETALRTLSWLALALLLAVDRRWRSRPVAIWGRRILAALVAFQLLALHLLALNPLGHAEPVGSWPIANLLLLAYGLPAVLGMLYLWYDPPPLRVRTQVVAAAGGLAFALVSMNLALEIRHSFHGPVLMGRQMSNAEWYSYSAGFLVFAVLLMAVALRWRLGWLRHGAFALLLAVVVKVFLSDMAALQGMYRVVSFLGLGLCLIGVGYLYQRVLLPARGAPKPETEAPPEPPEV